MPHSPIDNTLQSDKEQFWQIAVHDCTCKPPLLHSVQKSKTGIQGSSLTRPPRPKSPPDPIGADEAAPELGGADAAALELVVLVLHSSGTICQSRCCPCMSHMYAVTQKSSGLAYLGKTNLAVDP